MMNEYRKSPEVRIYTEQITEEMSELKVSGRKTKRE
jgi:hypothetical protein